MRLRQVLDNWKHSLTDSEMVTKMSLDILEKDLKDNYHLLPRGNFATNLKEDTLMDNWVKEMKEYHDL